MHSKQGRKNGYSLMSAIQKLTLWSQVITEFSNNINQVVGLILNDNAPYIEDLITEFQLWSGTDGDGNPITPAYTPYTVSIKTLKGQPSARVTLKDSGDFYLSVTIKIEGDGFYFESDDPKADDLIGKYGKATLKLNQENLQSVIWDYIYADIMSQLKFNLFGENETI